LAIRVGYLQIYLINKEIPMKRVQLFIVAAVLVVGVIAQSAQAAIINVALTPGLNTLNDRDVARLSLDINGNGLIDEGDQIETILIIDNISNSTFGGTLLGTAVGDATYQLTAHTISTVDVKTDLGGGVFLFETSATTNIYEDSSTIGGVLLADFSSQSADDAVDAATDGDLILTVDTSGSGAGGEADIFNIVGSDDFADLVTGNEANFVFANSIVANPGLVPIIPDATLSGLAGVPAGTGDLHDVVGVGEEEVASASVAAQGWAIQSDTTISFTVSGVIPELASGVVWGVLTLIGGLFAPRQRRV
jgi:hypothetical protein